ncbi:MAG TPA: AI-2E family transporter, partial [Gammaproteobacteria bacterium]|nr:AI-2E family transporter [Gammaproteobacteria bacterium]
DMIQHMRVWGNALVSASISSIPSLFMLIVYLVLVPLMVFFFLKDNNKIINWCTAFLPKERDLLSQVWDDIDDQIGNYVRGKVLEVLIVGAVTYLFLIIFSVQYSVLLATLVGLSVLVPYVGAVVVTFPIVLVAYFQWGIGTQFTYILIGYGIIQSLDGYVLVPLLFSEAVNLHPVAIIVAILFFGGVWGFWGVFFAIPLATVVKAVIDAWPRPHAMVA